MGKLIQSGPRNAKIVFVGEAPGATEESTGQPFVGGAGEVLNKMLDRAGIMRSDCFVTNVCHVRPPGNDFKWFYKKENQAQYLKGVIQLRKDILEINPNVVVALGAQPLRALTNKIGIEKWRGSILPSSLIAGKKVIGTYHPAAILRTFDYKGVAEFDLMRAARESLFPEINYPERAFYLPGNKIVHRVGTQWETDNRGYSPQVIIDEMLASPVLSVDIECWQKDDGRWELACVGFADRPDRALVLLLSDISAIRALCGSPAQKILQNGTFDSTVLKSNGIELTNFTYDTMLAHHSLIPECASGSDEMASLSGKKRQAAFSKGLAFLCSIHTNEPHYKDDSKLWKEDGDLLTFFRYNALDCAVTAEVRIAQLEDFKAFGTWNVFQHEMSLVRPLMAMTETGFKIDTAERERMRVKYVTELERLQSFLNTTTGETVNVKSPDVRRLIYDKLKIPVKLNTKTGRPTADKHAIVELAEKYQHPVLLTILKIRERRDMLERYIAAPIDDDGRMRCSFDITGTRSGRLSSRKSIHGSGTNLQNQPLYIRRMFVADEGKLLISRDYSQAEAWVVARLAKSQLLIDLLADPTRDVHRENAARIFNKAIADITYEERYLAKRVVHACNYGMGAHLLVSVVNEDAEITGVRIDYKYARQLIEKYFMLYPEIQSVYWYSIAQELRYSRTLTTPFGRKRQFFARWDDKLLRDAYSFIPQSTIGDLGCKALVNIYRDIEIGRPELDVQLLAQVHDSVVVQAPKQHIATVVDLMTKAMAVPITMNGEIFTIPSDTKVGANWGSYSEDNINGLADWPPHG